MSLSLLPLMPSALRYVYWICHFAYAMPLPFSIAADSALPPLIFFHTC